MSLLPLFPVVPVFSLLQIAHFFPVPCCALNQIVRAMVYTSRILAALSIVGASNAALVEKW